VTDNRALNSGGGVSGFGGTLVMTGSAVTGNEVTGRGFGGGVYLTGSAAAQIRNSTVAGNEAQHCGGIYLFSSGSTYGSLALDNSPVTGNKAGGMGPGLYVNTGAPVWTVAVTSSIRAGKSRLDLAPVGDAWTGGPVTVVRSAVGNAADLPLTPASGGNLSPGTPLLLGPLADNGGRTRTHALLPGSPAYPPPKAILPTMALRFKRLLPDLGADPLGQPQVALGVSLGGTHLRVLEGRANCLDHVPLADLGGAFFLNQFGPHPGTPAVDHPLPEGLEGLGGERRDRHKAVQLAERVDGQRKSANSLVGVPSAWR
jgi:hypothetical protein